MQQGKRFALLGVCVLWGLVCGYILGFRIARDMHRKELSAPVAAPLPSPEIPSPVIVPEVKEIVESPEPDIAPPVKISESFRYPVESLLRVVDGDTMDVRFRIWEDIVLEKRLRLLGVNTPELHPKSGTAQQKAMEKQKAAEALLFVRNELDNAAAIYVITSDWKSDSFGRMLAGIRYVDKSGNEKDLGDVLLKSGHAVIYMK